MKSFNVLLATTLFVILSAVYVQSQTMPIEAQRISYSYDDSGNRIIREILLVKPKTQDDDNEFKRDSLGREKSNTLSEGKPYYSDRFGSNDVRIYPNPTSGQLKLEFVSPVEYYGITISVYSLTGKLVYRKKMMLNPEEIDLSNQLDGVYLMTIENEVNRISWRIVKQ
ncbi:MAG: T9SS type A sorting domain-containing protein [Tenuifilaceae bacterium]|nr:T9SS type A sorting domain-containing protein [Tenuifilaceae bacterium]